MSLAEEEELNRLEKMPATTAISEHESREYKIISIRLKKRQEKHGWFRPARLVARQFKKGTMFEERDTFAPTSASVVPRLFAFSLMQMKGAWQMMVADVKDAFLMSKQPEGEKNAIKYRDRFYRLERCLPGQRAAAEQLFELFNSTARALGGEAGLMQLTLFRMKDLLISARVGDLLLLGSKEAMDRFIEHVTTKSGWKMEIEGSFRDVGDEFMYLKRKYNITKDGIVVRPDPRHIEELAEACEVGKKRPKSIPCSTDINSIAHGHDLGNADCARFRSCVGKTMCASGERPDAQFGIQCLARKMSEACHPPC